MLLLSLAGVVGCQKAESETATGKRPNILFAIMDDASFPHVGAGGCTWVRTPHFDRVAGEGILFTNAYTPNAKCAPSRSSILTGRNSWQLEEAANHWCFFPQKFKTYPEVLSENGYHVGYTDKGWAPGIAMKAGQPRQLTGKEYSEKTTAVPTKDISIVDYAANFEAFINDKKKGEPFCFWYGSQEPHRGYEYGSGLAKGNKNLSDIEEVYDFWPDNDTVRTDLLDYAFEIEYFDEQLGKMLQLLEEKEELDNTIVVVTSDNGMPFPRIKGQEYELSNHLPLAIMWKEGMRQPNRVVDDMISFVDFAPTFLEAAGVDPEASGMMPIQGRSLLNIFSSSKSGVVDPGRDHVLIGKERHDIGRPNDQGYPIRGIVKGGYLLVKNFEINRWPAGDPITGYLNCDGSPTKTVLLNGRTNPETFKYWEWSFGKRPEYELYNIKEDMICLNNLVGDKEYTGLMEALKHQLFSELKEQGDPRMLDNGHVFDNYVYANPKGVNFYERFVNGEKMETPWVNATDFEKNNLDHLK